MFYFFQHLFDANGFVPRWICGQWSGGLGWTHILADIAIFLAYAAIPAMLIYFVRRQKGTPYLPIYWLFACFILACGFTHLIDATIFWHPWYRLSALVKVITAVISWVTVVALFKAIPAGLSLPGLARINKRLVEEMERRQETQNALLKSEERLRLATDAGGLGIWHWEVETDVVTWENDWPYKLLGIPPQSGPVNAETFARDFVYPEDRATFAKAVEEAMTSKLHFFFRGRMIRPDGEKRWVEFTGKALHREEGRPPALIGTTRDITDRMVYEEALRKANDHLENVLGSITDGLAVLDKDWRYTYFNQQGADMLGLRSADMVGGCIWDLFPEAEGTLFYERYHRAVETGKPEHFQEYYPAPLNKWLECHCYPTSEGLSVYFHDVTDRVNAENIVKRNAALFSNLVELAPLGMYVVDAGLRLVQINPLALPTFAGIDPFYGRDLLDVMETIWGKKVGGEVTEIFRHTLETGEIYVSPPFVHDRFDWGVEQAFEWQTQRVTLPNGEYAVVCYFTDVTEKRKTQQALIAGRESLRKRTEELETLLDAAPVCVWITTDAHCEVIIGNRAANDLTNIAPGTNISQSAAAEGQAVCLKQLKEDGTEFRPDELPLQRAIATGQPVLDALLDFRFSDGRSVKALGNAVPLFDEAGQVRGGISAFHDVTPLKKAEADLIEAREAAEAANASKDRFLAMLSHELRTPLNPALMAISLLETDPDLKPETREDIAMIKRNLELEGKLIDDLLDVSRLTMDKLVLEPTSVELNAVINDVCTICREDIEGKNLQINVELTNEIGYLSADPARLRQILWNLLRNAIKFTPEGGSIGVRSTLLAPNRCEVIVWDTGRGLAPDQVLQIFSAFEQGGAQVTREYGGLGLGLAICKALVELHGGSIRAQSAGLGQGTSFVVELPV